MTEPAKHKLKVVVIAGPTASGKSALAFQLAQRVGGELCVADSRQVYRRMDIGTAKADAASRSAVVHHGVNVVEPTEDFDAARFRELAAGAIERGARRGVLVILEGGTGLYLRALMFGLVEAPSRDEAFRDSLRAEAERVGWPALHARLAQIDPDYAARIQPTDPVRITRALEVHHLTGTSLTAHHERHGFKECAYETLGVVLDVDTAVLRTRIAQRVDGMWRAGLLEETRTLAEELGDNHRLLGTINYAQALEHLRGRMSAEQAREEMIIKTAQFAKRQRTWFRAEKWLRPLPQDARESFMEEAAAFVAKMRG